MPKEPATCEDMQWYSNPLAVTWGTRDPGCIYTGALANDEFIGSDWLLVMVSCHLPWFTPSLSMSERPLQCSGLVRNPNGLSLNPDQPRLSTISCWSRAQTIIPRRTNDLIPGHPGHKLGWPTKLAKLWICYCLVVISHTRNINQLTIF